jgi:hypothetical protein
MAGVMDSRGPASNITRHSPPRVGFPRAASFGGPPTAAKWTTWLRSVERWRRQTAAANHGNGNGNGNGSRPRIVIPIDYLAAITVASFQLDGHDVSNDHLMHALAHGVDRRQIRSRQSQRIRNHLAILRRITAGQRPGRDLRAAAVVRWYTSVSCGLSTTALDDTRLSRIDAVVRRMNSPQLRLQPAIQEIARLHVQLLTDPLMPSFNGILARLLLEYHLCRCGLPPVLFDPASDAAVVHSEPLLLGRLLDLIEAAFGMVIPAARVR